MSFVIFDTEYTTWPGCQEKGWHGNQKKEIVQIAALKVSDELEVLAKLNLLCRPVVNSILSDYFINLTHITNQQVKQYGEPFPSAYRKFETFVGEDICYSHAWGKNYGHESDGEIMKENMLLTRCTCSKNIVYRNIAPVFVELYQQNNIHIPCQSSGQIVKFLGLEEKMQPLNSDVHNAFYDTYSILEGLKFFYPQSVQILQRLRESDFIKNLTIKWLCGISSGIIRCWRKRC